MSTSYTPTSDERRLIKAANLIRAPWNKSVAGHWLHSGAWEGKYPGRAVIIAHLRQGAFVFCTYGDLRRRRATRRDYDTLTAAIIGLQLEGYLK